MQDIYFDNKKVIHEISTKSSARAFRIFFDHYYAKLLHFSIMILRNEEKAKDVVLEVFEKIWEQRTQLLSIKNIDKYLFVITKNKSIDHLRKKKELVALEHIDVKISETIIMDHPESVLLDKELMERLNSAVTSLPEKCRLVYRLVKEDGLKYKEVSELLDLSPKTVDNHINNAMSKIRQEISAYLGKKKEKGILWKVIKTLLIVFSI